MYTGSLFRIIQQCFKSTERKGLSNQTTNRDPFKRNKQTKRRYGKWISKNIIKIDVDKVINRK